MLIFIALIIAGAALTMALGVKAQANRLSDRLDETTRTLDRLRLELARLSSALNGPQTPPAAPPQPEAAPTPPVAPTDGLPVERPPASVPEVPSRPATPSPTPVGAWQAQPVARADIPASADSSPSSASPGTPAGPPPSPPEAGSEAAPSSRPLSLEEWLGTRWAVWLGGLALGLGGLLLVRYSIEQGYFGPGARLVMGVLFAVALLVSGEWFRRTERTLGLETAAAAHVPSALTAAGTATMFGTIYAAHALYGFIGSGTAFVLLGVISISTMFAAALHGPALAGFGLLGAYVAPLLVSSVRPSPWPFVIYLATVAASALGLARLRNWLWLAAAGILGAVVWGLFFASRLDDPDWTIAAYTHTFLQLLLAAGFIAIAPHLGTRDEDARLDRVASLALGALTALAIAMIAIGRTDLASAIPFAVAASALLLVTAWRSAPAAAAACYSGLIVLATVAVWPGLSGPPPTSLMAPELAALFRIPENVQTYLILAALMCAGVAIGTAQRLWEGARLSPPVAGTYVLAATVTPLLALVLTWARVKHFGASFGFAFAGLALAGIFAAASERFRLRGTDDWPGQRLVSAGCAAAAVSALSIALMIALDRGFLTVALALTALAAAWLADRRDIPLLRHVVSALAIIVLVRIVLDPRIMGADVGRWPILNWLLVGYGVSSAAFYGAARLMERREADVSQRLADAISVLLAGLLAFFQIRHALNNGDPFAPSSDHIEIGLMALVSLGFSHALMHLDALRRNQVFHWASLAFAALSAGFIGIGLGLLVNPLFTDAPIKGSFVFSSLLLAYLLPGLAALYLARASRDVRPDWFQTGLGLLTAGLLFTWVTLEVRHGFQGPRIGFWRGLGAAEQWAYSAVWLALGVAFLAYGLWRNHLLARIVSALLVALSVAKVFLIDLAGLTGLWRALSFIVLGVVLIGIGIAYQNFVFAKPRQLPPAPPPEPPLSPEPA